MATSLKTVYLYGKLKERIGLDKIELVGGSVYELIEGLSANFKKQLQPSLNEQRIVAKVRGFDTEEDIRRPLKDDETEIHLYPTLLGGGGGNGGLFKMIIGAIIIAVVAFAVVATGGALLAPASWALTSFGSALLTAGVGLFVGGLIEMLTPQPKLDMSSSNDLESSKYLGSQGNTVKIGTPIPLLFGRHKFYGHYISFNVDAKNVAA